MVVPQQANVLPVVGEFDINHQNFNVHHPQNQQPPHDVQVINLLMTNLDESGFCDDFVPHGVEWSFLKRIKKV